MKFLTATALLASMPLASTFMTPGGLQHAKANDLKATAEKTVTDSETQRPIYDPLGLYPESSEEKKQGRVRPLEPKLKLSDYRDKKVRDPMGLYPKNSPEFLEAFQQEQASKIADNERPIYDPMSLYTASTPERQEGKIQPMEPAVDVPRDTNDPMGLYPRDSQEYTDSITLERESIVSKNQDLYDPLGLYPASSVEYKEGRIKALEPQLEVVKPVLDPLGLYSQQEQVDKDVVMSKSLPFMPQPALLEGDLVGDAGFDPLGLAKSKEGLLWQREAELKHSRIAMLAAAGWPLAELFHQKLASLLHLQPILVEGGRVPSLLNGGLQQVNPFYWMGILSIAGLFEAVDMMNKDNNDVSLFDPMGLYPKDEQGQERMQLAEIKNGRLAMLAITAFAAAEAFTNQAVFHPPF